MTNRWYVKINVKDYDDVGAYSLEIEDGALVFRNAELMPTVIYAPGQWLHVDMEDN